MRAGGFQTLVVSTVETLSTVSANVVIDDSWTQSHPDYVIPQSCLHVGYVVGVTFTPTVSFSPHDGGGQQSICENAVRRQNLTNVETR